MIADLKPYPAYKDSGVTWLGEVPKHWEVLPNRALFTEVKERDQPNEQMLSVTITKGIIPQQSLLTDSSKKDSSNQDKAAYKLVRLGDIAYNKMRAWQGAVGASDYQGIISPAYVVQRPRIGVHSRYMHSIFRTPAFAKEAERWSYGITSDMWSLRPEHFKMIYGCLPSFPEQAAIVRFLDYADRRIRRYIGAKQKLIALLNEQKQAIIHQAVTKGLNPNVEMKPSGVEWLGEVPEHWEIVKLGHLVNLTTGFPFKSDNFSHNEEDIRLLRGINVSPGKIRWDTVVRWPRSEVGAFSIFEMQVGDIVLGMDRPIIGSGVRIAVIQQNDLPSLLLQRVARIRTHEELDSNLALLWLSGKGFSDYLAPIFTGISVPHISPEQIRSFRIGLPGKTEQVEIVKRLKQETASLDLTLASAHQEISLLREYRTRLIADVVTGKLDVREAAANLPDEIDDADDLPEVEALDEAGEPLDDLDDVEEAISAD